MDKRELNFYFKIIIKTLVSVSILFSITILVGGFMKVERIEWKEFIEFVAFCLLLFFIINPKLNIKVPGVFEIKTELGEIRKNLSVVAQNISNIKIDVDSKQSIDFHPSFTGSAKSDASTINFIPEENNTLTKEINKIN